MALENSAGLGVLASYGKRTTEGKFGGMTGDDVVKHIVYDVSWEDLPAIASSDAAYVFQGLDYVIPAGSVFLSCRYIVDTAVVGPTAITAGTYTFNRSTGAITAHAAEGLMTAAVGVVTGLGTAGDVLVGSGALLAGGDQVATPSDTVIRILPTVAGASAGKLRVYVSYLAPLPY